MYWKEWLQTLLSLVVLLGIVEMLLPSGELAKFSQLVLGLALLLAVLQPLTLMLNGDLQGVDLSWISGMSREPQVQVLAERIQLAAATPFLQQDEGALATQIEKVLLSLEQIEDVQVEIDSSKNNHPLVTVSVKPFAADLVEVVQQVVASMINVPVNEVLVKRWPK
ncbi:MAG TPA: hypothetical protein DDW87_08340 [Firmicutes bacterium]|nr:hypothetical protein [Bacillota bacterium]